MALDDLIAALHREAEAEAAAIRAAARAEVDAIQRRTDTDLDERRARVAGVRERDRQVAVELALVSARHSARREHLEARRRALARVLDAVRQRFPQALASEGFQGALPGQLEEALHCLGARPGTLRVHPTLLDPAGGAVAGQSHLTLVPDPAIGAGFLLQSDDGAVEINGTLEDRLERQASRIALEIMAALEHAP